MGSDLRVTTIKDTHVGNKLTIEKDKIETLGAILKYPDFYKMAIQQTRTCAGRTIQYRYTVKNHDTSMEANIYGKELYYDDIFHPDEKNYEGVSGLAPDLSTGVKEKLANTIYLVYVKNTPKCSTRKC